MGRVDIYPTTALQGPPSAALGYAEVTTGQTGISTATSLTGLSITVTVPTGRRLRVTGHGQIANDATAGSALGEIMEGATILGRWCRTDVPASASTFSDEGGVIISPTAGTHTYNLRLTKNVGGGVIDFQATTNNPGFILVEDITGTFWNGVPVTNPPACRVFRNSNQSINNSTWTAILFDNESFDTDTIHDNVTNNSRLTCKTAGVYAIDAQVQFGNNATGNRLGGLRLNSTGVNDPNLGFAAFTATQGAQETSFFTSYSVKLAVNDYVEMMVWQNSGGALNLTTLDGGCHFSAVWVALG